MVIIWGYRGLKATGLYTETRGGSRILERGALFGKSAYNG